MRTNVMPMRLQSRQQAQAASMAVHFAGMILPHATRRRSQGLALLNPCAAELVEPYGYVLEHDTVQTVDGYLLGLYRIPSSPRGAGGTAVSLPRLGLAGVLTLLTRSDAVPAPPSV